MSSSDYTNLRKIRQINGTNTQNTAGGQTQNLMMQTITNTTHIDDGGTIVRELFDVPLYGSCSTNTCNPLYSAPCSNTIGRTGPHGPTGYTGPTGMFGPAGVQGPPGVDAIPIEYNLFLRTAQSVYAPDLSGQLLSIPDMSLNQAIISYTFGFNDTVPHLIGQFTTNVGSVTDVSVAPGLWDLYLYASINQSVNEVDFFM